MYWRRISPALLTDVPPEAFVSPKIHPDMYQATYQVESNHPPVSRDLAQRATCEMAFGLATTADNPKVVRPKWSGWLDCFQHTV
jgi:hypothetical protein